MGEAKEGSCYGMPDFINGGGGGSIAIFLWFCNNSVNHLVSLEVSDTEMAQINEQI